MAAQNESGQSTTTCKKNESPAQDKVHAWTHRQYTYHMCL